MLWFWCGGVDAAAGPPQRSPAPALQSRSLATIVSPALDRLPLSRPIALTGLTQLQQVANVPGLKDAFRIQSLDSLRSATLGPPIAVFTVPLDSLKPYQRTKDPASLLVDRKRAFYPINIGGQPRLLIAVEQSDSGWTRRQTGGATYADRIFTTRNNRMAAADGARVRTFLVEIEHTSLSFIGVWTAHGLDLMPLSDNREHHWTQGEAYPARDVFGALVSLAAQYHDRARSRRYRTA